MNNLTLTCKDSGDFKPHPEGIHPAVCVDVMDLGLVETDFQGVKKLVNKVKVVFETEMKTTDGSDSTVAKSFTASLHPKSNLSGFLSKWRGRPVAPGESIQLEKLIGACCTLVISHQKSLSGKTYASIDAVSKPTKRVAPSGQYDPAAARQRYADWKAKQAGNITVRPVATAPAPAPVSILPALSKSHAAPAAPAAAAPQPEYDPEVGF